MQIACPACRKQLRVPDTAAGKTVKCPACAKTFQAIEVVEEEIQSAPPKRAPKPAPPPVRDEIEEAPAPRRRRDRGRDEEDDDDRPRRRRERNEEDEDYGSPRRRRDREEDFDDLPRSRRGRDDYDDEVDAEDYKRDKKEARRRAGSASIWFLLAGIISLVIVAYGVISSLFLNIQIAPMGNQGAFQAGRIAGLIGCGAIGAIGAVSQFMAASGLKSFRNKGMVVTAIVFGFIFGILFGIVAILGIIAMAGFGRILGGGLMILLVVEVILRSAGAFLNLFAAIKGIVTLNNREVSRQFNR